MNAGFPSVCRLQPVTTVRWEISVVAWVQDGRRPLALAPLEKQCAKP